MNHIRFVYFDIGGVMFSWKIAVKKFSVFLNKPYSEVFAVVQKYDDDICRGKISPNHLLQYFIKELDLDIQIDDFLNMWTDNFEPILVMHEFVKEVSRKYKIGIITNIYQGAFVQILTKGHIPNIPYKTIIQSCELNLIKPEKAFFIHAQEKASVNPGEILYIDDSKRNLEEASKLGWNTVLFDEKNPGRGIKQARKMLLL